MRLLIGVAVLTLAASSSLAQSWLLETVDIDNIGRRSSIIVDASHVPHIAATKWYDGRFYFHSRTPGGWERAEIARYGGLLSGRAMRLDTNGFARIIMEMQMAVQGPAGWTIVSAPGGHNSWEAMAIDPAGKSHVAYIWSWGSGSYNGGFKYDWDDLAPNVFTPTWASCEMEYDGNGDLYIVAMLDLGSPIQLWRHVESGWVTEDIGAGAWPSIALDAENNLHICYYAYPARDLVHAVRNAENSYTTHTIDSEGDVGELPSLAIDAQGRLNVSYYDVTRGDLRFARSADGGTTWVRTTVHSAGNVGKSSSLAVDGDVVHISYTEPVGENESILHYARLTGSLTAVGGAPGLRRASIRAVPNPFNPSTRIQYVVPARGRVKVTIFDATGRVVENLVDEDQAPGTYQAHYRARTPSGVYFARLDVAGEQVSTKIVLLK